MKWSLAALVTVCSSLLLGCGSSPPAEVTKQLEKAHKTEFPMKQGIEAKTTPEYIANNADSPRELANYLRELEKDAKFDPKQHVEMLKKYENDADSDVSTVAKELLAKAQ